MEHYCDNHDVLNDVTRLKKKCKQLDNQWVDFKKTVEEKDIDRDYQRMLRFVLGKAETFEQHKRKRDNVAIIDVEDNDGDRESDPQYELFLGGLKEHNKSYVAEGDNTNSVPPYIEYESESCSKDELKHERCRKTKRRVKKMNRPFNQKRCGSDVRALCIGECDIAQNQYVGRSRRGEEGKVHSKINRHLNKGKNVVRDDRDEARRDVSHMDNKPSYRELDRKSNRNVYVDQARPVTKNRLQRHRKVKWKDMVDGDNEDTKPTVQIDSENFYRERGPRKNRAKGDRCKCVDHLDCSVKAQSSRKRTHCDIRNVKAEKSSKEGDDDIDPDVEILDDAGFRKNLSSFVPSKRFHKSMEDDTSFHHVGSTSACDGFRKQILDVLKKPFDKEELKRLREAVRDGSYYHYYPDLERKLKKSRYKRGKCLNIFRGFFFWLQNVSQQGSFKPWQDGQCLAIEPGSPENSPPPHSTYLDRAKQSKCKILK